VSWQASTFDLLLRATCKSAPGDSLAAVTHRFNSLLDGASRLMPLPDSVQLQSATLANVACEWVVAETARTSRDVLIYVHGGAFAWGSARSHRDVVWRLSAVSRRRVLSLNYRLGPEHPFPAALDDALAVYRALREGGYRSARVAVAGDSAGANLALSTIARLSSDGEPLPDACICLSPWVDLTHSGGSVSQNASHESMLRLSFLANAARAYAGDQPLHAPQISPLFASLSGFPPLLIYASDSELLLDDARRLAARALAAEVPVKLCVWPKQAHAFPTAAAFVPEARQALAEIGRFLIQVEPGRTGSDVFEQLAFRHSTEIERTP
jgi:acetyl esterase/lipase